MLRSCSRLAKGVACWAPPRCSAQVAPLDRVSLHPSCTALREAAVRFSHSGKPKDFSLPNASWSPAMMDQFQKFTELSKDKTWKRVPSYGVFIDQIPGMTREDIEKSKKKGSRLFLRNLDIEGAGFEYVMFVNQQENRLVCLFQPGPYLEGPPGFVHGGATATLLDSALGGCAIFAVGYIMTANLNINYKSPIPLGSVVLADCKVDRQEGRKVFVSGHMQSADGQTLHAEATAQGLAAKSSSKSNLVQAELTGLLASAEMNLSCSRSVHPSGPQDVLPAKGVFLARSLWGPRSFTGNQSSWPVGFQAWTSHSGLPGTSRVPVVSVTCLPSWPLFSPRCPRTIPVTRS